MTRWAAAALILAGLVGCGGRQMPMARTPEQPQFFAPTSMHLSPVFTKIADFDGDNDPDGIEAVVELQDRFGDPTKAAGRIVFQIYRFRPYAADPRDILLAGPFEGRLDSPDSQKARWDRVNRAYIFQLAYPLAALDKDYVVDAMFESNDGKRLFDRLFVEGDHTKPTGIYTPLPLPTTGPATAPATTQTSAGATTRTTPAPGSITTQEYHTVPVTSQPHEPPPRADQP